MYVVYVAITMLMIFTNKRSKDTEVVQLNAESPSRTKAKRHISGASPLRPARILEKECIWRTYCGEVGEMSEMSKLGPGAALHINNAQTIRSDMAGTGGI